jgi:probable phosphoglycerate mutase
MQLLNIKWRKKYFDISLQSIMSRMNYLETLKTLKNRYFAIMRHGESTANQKGLIANEAEYGVPYYSLSDFGRLQVEQSVQTNTLLSGVSIIISSDFKRALESAEIVHRLLICRDEVKLS